MELSVPRAMNLIQSTWRRSEKKPEEKESAIGRKEPVCPSGSEISHCLLKEEERSGVYRDPTEKGDKVTHCIW